MTRHVIQMRPQNDPNGRQYAPQRDLANIFLPMVTEVFAGLDAEHMSFFFKDWFERDGLTDSDVGDAADCLVTAVQLFTRDATIKQPYDAFVKAGVTNLPVSLRAALFARIGEVLIGGFFVAIRDVTVRNEESTCQEDMARMIAAGRDLSSRMSGELASYEVNDLDILHATIEEQRRVINQAAASTAKLEVAQDELNSKVAAMTAKLDAHADVITFAERASSGGVLSRIINPFKAAIAIIRRPHGQRNRQ